MEKIVLYLKKSIGVSLLLCIITLTFGITVSANTKGSCGTDLNWEISNGVLSITGTGEMTDYGDNNFAPWYEQAKSIKVIVLPEKLKSIGDFAFYGCSQVTSITIPSAVTRIGSYAFAECTDLVSVNLGSGLISIGRSSFEECSSLFYINLPTSLESIGSRAFYGCKTISTVTVPKNVVELGNSVFAYCSGLVRVTIDAQLKQLPSWTFYGCSKLTDVSLADIITDTGEYAFQECNSLKTVYTQSEDVEIAYKIQQSIDSNNDTVPAGVVATYGLSDSSVNDITDGDSYIQTTITETDNALISFKNSSDFSTEDAVINFDIDVAIKTAEGWNELEDTVETAESLANDDLKGIDVNIQLWDGIVEEDSISKLAGNDITLNIISKDGTTWKVDMSQTSEDSFKGSYDFDVSLEKVDSEKVDIASDTIYSTKFSSTTNFNTSVGIAVDNAYQLATLYQKKGGSYEALQTVVVDENGKAWFNLASIDKGTDYFIGINADGVTTEDAVIPESLYSQYGIDEVSYLTDEKGTRYELTGRYSKWGITGKQFAIYVGIAVGLIVVIVTVVMIAINKMSKSKAKYMRYADEPDEEPIDEEAMRLQIMKEMLEEQKKNSGKKSK